MSSRLKAEIWIKAHMRVCQVQGGQAFVVRHGDDNAGSILLKLNRLDGSAALLEPGTGPDGARLWLWVVGPAFAPEATVEASIARALKRDPDLWVLEIEDRQGRHFLSEPVG